MRDRKQFLRRAIGQWYDFLDFQIAENAVVQLTALLLPEQPEEQEYVADANALTLKVGLSCAALPEQAFTGIREHGIVMAKVIRSELAAAGGCGMLTQAQGAIGRRAGRARRDRQA